MELVQWPATSPPFVLGLPALFPDITFRNSAVSARWVRILTLGQKNERNLNSPDRSWECPRQPVNLQLTSLNSVNRSRIVSKPSPLNRRSSLSSVKGRGLLPLKLPAGEGAYHFPTVLTDVQKGAPAYDEEAFGPVAAIITVADDEEAVRVAKDSVFGLGAAIFTRDVKRGERIAAEELLAGSCFANSFVKSDPRLPFGGIKQFGYGRELSSFGIREFVNVKTVYVK